MATTTAKEETSNKVALLSTAYFPPIEYFVIMAKYSVIYIEAHENYQKQSYRNRCWFYAADGPQTLNVPVVHRNGTFKLPITQIEIDYSTPWVVRTERAIEAAYCSSAFFEYYRDELFSILDSHPVTLFELNTRLTEFFVRKCGLKLEIRTTQTYAPAGCKEDFREIIHPKRTNTILEDNGLRKPYFQVFSRKYGFISNLSIMDLLFNEGPNAITYLKSPSKRQDDIQLGTLR